MVLIPNLATIDEAAAELGINKGSLKATAERHGFLVRIGRFSRIDRNTYQELIDRCREKPQELAFTSDKTKVCGSSETPVTLTNQQVLATVEMLKGRSRPTSQARGSSPAPVTRIASR